MPAHATWKGSLNVSLVSVAVKAYAQDRALAAAVDRTIVSETRGA